MQFPCNFRPVRRALRVGVVVAVVALTSCGGPKTPKTYPVKGTILVDGQPAVDCQIYLHRTPPDGGPNPVTPQGTTNKNGEFQITSFLKNDGAPEGEYVATIEWRERTGLAKQNLDGPDRLGGAYAKADATKGMPGFAVKVGKQPLTLPPFELKQSADAKRKFEAAKKQKPGLGGPLGGGS